MTYVVSQYGEEFQFDDYAEAVRCLASCDVGAEMIHAETGVNETSGAAHYWMGYNDNDLSAVPEVFVQYLEDHIAAYEAAEYVDPNREHSTYSRGVGL